MTTDKDYRALHRAAYVEHEIRNGRPAPVWPEEKADADDGSAKVKILIPDVTIDIKPPKARRILSRVIRDPITNQIVGVEQQEI